VTPVITLGIVPAQPIVEEVVQEGCARLLPKAICFQNSIWLSFLQRACVGPSIELSSVVYISLSHTLKSSGPEPASDIVRLESCLFTAVNLLVAQPAASPHLPHIAAGHDSSDTILLSLALNTDQVHATLPAVVPGSEPIPASIPEDSFVTVPGEPVGLPSDQLVSFLVFSTSTEVGFREAHFSTAAWVDLGTFGIFGTISSYTIATELAIVLSSWTSVVLTRLTESVVLRFCQSEAENSKEEESL